jgi:hypothetical protein
MLTKIRDFISDYYMELILGAVAGYIVAGPDKSKTDD